MNELKEQRDAKPTSEYRGSELSKPIAKEKTVSLLHSHYYS